MSPTTTAAMPLPINQSNVPFTAKNEASTSGVSWGAVSGGAFVAAALLLSLSTLGAGVGLSSLSPWSNAGVSPSAVGMGALVWLAFIEVFSCAIGGYVAGRLRTKWVDVHSDEVYFRDTAHGLLVWAVAFVVMAAFLASAGGALASGESRGGTSRSESSRSGSMTTDANRYFVDSLFRSGTGSGAADEGLRAEAGGILAQAIHQKELSPEDKNYLAAMVAAKTGMSQADSDKRVTDVFERDQQAVDTARKSLAHSLYWMFLALLLGAFAASLAATFGGQQRDHVLAPTRI